MEANSIAGATVVGGEPTITYVEFGHRGHRPIWIRAVVEAFRRKASPGELSVWVNPEFRELHGDWCEEFFAPVEAGRNVRFHSHQELMSEGEKGRSLPAYSFETILRCLRRDRARAGFLANNTDSCLRSIALAPWGSVHARLVGVMDYPFLHYRRFGVPQDPEWLPARLYWSLWVKNLVASRRRMLSRIFMMDPYATEYYNRILFSRKYQFLPEAFMPSQPLPNGRQHFGLPEDRLILLFIGPVEARKGIRELLRAVEEMWSASPALRRQVALVVAGVVLPDTRDTVYSAFERIRAAYPETGLFLFERMLDDREFATLVGVADVVCIPYVRCFGTSGLLVHAAQAGRPVLGPDFGVVGELVRRHRLGVTCNTARPEALLEGVNRVVELARQMDARQRDEIRNFVRNNTIPVAEFGERIVDALFEACA